MIDISKVIFLLSVITLSACQSPQLIKPEGFAPYANSEYGYRSVSPERVMYRVHTHKNEDNADLAFWKTALKTHMRDSGYIELAESDVTAKSTPGYLLTLAAPVGAKDYTYLIAIFVHKDKLVVFESAGETQYFDKYKDKITRTITNTDLESAARL